MLRKSQYKFSLFISLSDIYESVANPNPEVRSSGTVLNVTLYCTTRPDLWIKICTHINISDILPDETSHMQFGLVNVRWSMVTI